MHFYETERVALFIDGANLYATSKALGFDIDYKRLLVLFRQKAQLVRALYYTALAEDQEYSSIRPLIDWLDYNGYTMVTKPTKEFTDASGRRKIKGNMDIELAVDAMRVTATSAAWLRRSSKKASASPSSRRCRPSRRWWPTSCAGRPTSSWTSRISKASSAAIRQDARRASPGRTRSAASPIRTARASRITATCPRKSKRDTAAPLRLNCPP
jgi:hypothetical protein